MLLDHAWVLTVCMVCRMEVVKLRSSSGIAKVTGVALCLAGVLVIALYIGPGISPINHHRVIAAHVLRAPGRVTWIKKGRSSWSLRTCHGPCGSLNRYSCSHCCIYMNQNL